MQGNFFSIRQIDENTHKRCNEYIGNRIKYFLEQGKPCYVKVEEYKNPRSLSANALMWMWFSEMAKVMNGRGFKIEIYNDDGSVKGVRDWDKDDAHDLMVKKYLGVEVKKMGSTTIKTLKKTSKLDSGKHCIFLEKVYQFMVDYFNHFLPDPAESQFREWKDKQNQ